jgi:hypothetical protein
MEYGWKEFIGLMNVEKNFSPLVEYRKNKQPSADGCLF